MNLGEHARILLLQGIIQPAIRTIMQLTRNIMNFRQCKNEHAAQARERMKSMLRKLDSSGGPPLAALFFITKISFIDPINRSNIIRTRNSSSISSDTRHEPSIK